MASPAPRSAPHPSVPEMLTALQQAIAELQAGREDHVKMETQQERIEELQAENRAQNAKIEKLMESDRRAQTSILLRMIDMYRIPLLEAARREETDTVDILLHRVRGDPTTSEFDRWVLDEHARLSESLRVEHS